MYYMLKNGMFVFFIFFSVQVAFSQSNKIIHGKIEVSNATPKGVHIINLTNKKESLSDEKGGFSIPAQPGDSILFSSVHLNNVTKLVNLEDLNGRLMLVIMTSKVVELDEVVIENYAGLNAVDLGILSQSAKKYSIAERRYRAGTRGPVSKLINLFGNQKRNLKNNINVESKAVALSKLEDMFPDRFYLETLRIPLSEIKAFHYFLVEDKAFNDVLNSKNKSLITFSMIDMAKKYVLLNQQ